MNILHYRELLTEIKNHVEYLLQQEDYNFESFLQELDSIVHKTTIISRNILEKEGDNGKT